MSKNRLRFDYLKNEMASCEMIVYQYLKNLGKPSFNNPDRALTQLDRCRRCYQQALELCINLDRRDWRKEIENHWKVFNKYHSDLAYSVS